MKKQYLFILFFLLSTVVFSQQDTNISEEDKIEKEEVFTIVEEMCSFPGGMVEMMKWVRNKIDSIGYPQMEKEAKISGTSYVAFVVDKDGNIKNPKIIQGVTGGPGYDKLALQVVNEMPRWLPAKQGGRAVSVEYNLPIKFSIPSPTTGK